MEIENNLSEEQILEQLEKKREYIVNLSIEEISEKLESALNETDVILEGYNLVNNIAVGDGIALAGILKLRETLTETLDWIIENLIDDDNIEILENDEL